MAVSAGILEGHVMHARLQPTQNQFKYRIYYVCLPLAQMAGLALPIDRPGLMSFYNKDHGDGVQSSLQHWARSILDQENLYQANGDILLLCMPRVLGYVFNPVSFWLCLDQQQRVRAVLCEVNNTFGDRHTYLCAHADHRPITPADTLIAQKLFHVSPFLPRNGEYRFRFDYREGHFETWIDYLNTQGEQTLVTSLAGQIKPMTKGSLISAFLRYPLVSMKAITLIHWQALQLFLRRVPFFRRPVPLPSKLTRSSDITKT